MSISGITEEITLSGDRDVAKVSEQAWTPVPNSITGVAEYIGYYTQIGNLFVVELTITPTTTISNTLNVGYVSGLPGAVKHLLAATVIRGANTLLNNALVTLTNRIYLPALTLVSETLSITVIYRGA